MIADAIGAEVEKIDTVWEKWAATERIEFPLGAVEKGNCAAIRFEIRAWVDGEPRIIVEHCNRLTSAAAPEWPRPKMGESDAYRVVIEGSPNIEQETTFRGRIDGDPNSGGCLSTGMRAIPAIPVAISFRITTPFPIPRVRRDCRAVVAGRRWDPRRAHRPPRARSPSRRES